MRFSALSQVQNFRTYLFRLGEYVLMFGTWHLKLLKVGVNIFGFHELKENLTVTPDAVECPVKGCAIKVPRQRDVFRRDQKYRCPEHKIYISPSTFEYEDCASNLLWTCNEDIALLNQIMRVKRESRIARDNSEDALTWNVFRFIETNGLVNGFTEEIIGTTTTNTEMVYWSYSQSQMGLWNMLNRARNEFELVPSMGSEPDIIIVGENALLIIEAKLTAINETKPSNVEVEEKYVSGGQGWWTKVFSSDFKEVVIKQRLYELARFWLLGTWMASQMGLDFYLVNLVLDKKDKDIEERFGRHIVQKDNQKFKRVTWEQISDMIETSGAQNVDTIKEYFTNKTIGYSSDHKLQHAFSSGTTFNKTGLDPLLWTISPNNYEYLSI